MAGLRRSGSASVHHSPQLGRASLATRRPPGWENWIGDTASDVSALVKIDDSRPAIGRGGYCHVYLGYHLRRGQVALKRPLVDPREYSKDSLKTIRAEVAICTRLKHNHILDFIGTCFLDNHVHLVSPYVPNGSLSDYIKSHPGLDRVRILKETADAIAYLHLMGIVHGDIKANNILVGKDEEAQICDFGLSKLLETKTMTTLKGAGSLRWQAPELFDNAAKSFQTDVYAYGITIAEVLQGSVPFSELKDTAIIMAVYHKNCRPETLPPASPSGASYAIVWDLAERCWCKAPGDRIAMREVFNALETRGSSTTSNEKPSERDPTRSQTQQPRTGNGSNQSTPSTGPVTSPQQRLKPSLPQLKVVSLDAEKQIMSPRALSWAAIVRGARHASEVVLQPLRGSAGRSPRPVREKLPETPLKTKRVWFGRGPAAIGIDNVQDSRIGTVQSSQSKAQRSSTPTISTDLPNEDSVLVCQDAERCTPSLNVTNKVARHSSIRFYRPPPSPKTLATRLASFVVMSEIGEGGADAEVDDLAPVLHSDDPPKPRPKTRSKPALRGDVDFRRPAGVSDTGPSRLVSFLMPSEIERRGKKKAIRRDDVSFRRPSRSSETLAYDPVSFMVASEVERDNVEVDIIEPVTVNRGRRLSKSSQKSTSKVRLRADVDFDRPPDLSEKLARSPLSFTIMSGIEGIPPLVSPDLQSIGGARFSEETSSSHSESTLLTPLASHSSVSWRRSPSALHLDSPSSDAELDHVKAVWEHGHSNSLAKSQSHQDTVRGHPVGLLLSLPQTMLNSGTPRLDTDRTPKQSPDHRKSIQDTHRAPQFAPPLEPPKQSISAGQRPLNAQALEFYPTLNHNSLGQRDLPNTLLYGTEPYRTALPTNVTWRSQGPYAAHTPGVLHPIGRHPPNAQFPSMPNRDWPAQPQVSYTPKNNGFHPAYSYPAPRSNMSQGAFGFSAHNNSNPSFHGSRVVQMDATGQYPPAHYGPYPSPIPHHGAPFPYWSSSSLNPHHPM